MSALPEIEQRIREDWPSEPAPLRLLAAVTTLREDGGNYITLPLLLQLLGALLGNASTKAGDREALAMIYEWAAYLASARIGLLSTHFELVRDDGSTELLEPDDIADAYEEDKLYDPRDGEIVANWRGHVAVYYSATPLLREILRERR